MSLAEQVYQTIKSLPEPMLQEILDFALFLRQREEQAEWYRLVRLQTGIMLRMRYGIMYQPSNIVLLPFPFTDLSASKKRPVLIVKAPNFQGDFIAVPITSQ
jgi:hypothetical protein